MMRYLVFTFFYIVTILFPLVGGATERAEYSSKLVLRTGFGMFQNAGTYGGSTAGVGGFDLQYHYFLNSYLSVGFGYGAQFDLNNGGVPLRGYEIVGRVYFLNEGTHTKRVSDWGVVESGSQWAPYILGQYSIRDFYLGPDVQSTDATKSLSGEYSSINLGAGMDYSLNRHFGFNAEISSSMFAFSSSDARVRISETIIWMGLNYVF